MRSRPKMFCCAESERSERSDDEHVEVEANFHLKKTGFVILSLSLSLSLSLPLSLSLACVASLIHGRRRYVSKTRQVLQQLQKQKITNNVTVAN